MRTAFKEWAVVVDALERGEQILIFRKGGIHEGKGGFKPEHSQFLFFPTRFHQQRESVLPEAQERFDRISPLFHDQQLSIHSWAEVADAIQIRDLQMAKRLGNQHIWREEVIGQRFEWGREQSIHCLLLRVHKLPRGVVIPMLPEYGGCKSWIELAEPIETEGSSAVIPDGEFSRRLDEIRSILKN
ncbi:MAG: DUF1802 family protein [Verrucomicrobiota bacterium]|nr:DUF1802 family protein [Verrucomicrobiota bacterium]